MTNRWNISTWKLFHLENVHFIFATRKYDGAQKLLSESFARNDVRIVLSNAKCDFTAARRRKRVDKCTQWASTHAGMHACTYSRNVMRRVCLLRPFNYGNRYRLWLALAPRISKLAQREEKRWTEEQRRVRNALASVYIRKSIRIGISLIHSLKNLTDS